MNIFICIFSTKTATLFHPTAPCPVTSIFIFAHDLRLLHPLCVLPSAFIFMSSLWLSLSFFLFFLFFILLWLVWDVVFKKLCADAVQKSCWRSFRRASSTRFYSSFPTAPFIVIKFQPLCDSAGTSISPMISPNDLTPPSDCFMWPQDLWGARCL